MRRDRYVAVLAMTEPARAAAEAALDRLISTSSFRKVIAGSRLVVASTASAALRLGDDGILQGALCTTQPIAAVSNLDPDRQKTILQTRGAHLIDAYWGGYVAIFSEDGGRAMTIVRAPLGELPCYWTKCDDMVIAASDMDVLLVFTRSRPAIAWGAVARQLLLRYIRRDETCLSNIRELAGGSRLSATDQGVTTEPLWSPWSFAHRGALSLTVLLRRMGCARRSTPAWPPG